MSAIEKEKQVLPYTFERSDQFSKSQLRSLRLIHDRFARNFSTAISVHLRSAVEVHLEEAIQVSYADFLSRAQDPTCISTLSLKPLDGLAAVEFEPEIIFPIIDRLLGGAGDPVKQARPMTEIERSVVQTVIRVLAENLQESWRPVCAIEFGLMRTEVHPHLAQVAPLHEMITQFQFRIRMRESVALMNLVLPVLVLAPIIHVFDQSTNSRRKVVSDGTLTAQLRQAPVNLSIETAQTMFPMNSLLSLQIGDTLVLDQRPTGPVQLKVAGKNKLIAKATGDSNRNAFEITGPNRLFREEKNGNNND